MTEVAFFDTNVLLYLFDLRNEAKRAAAQEIFKHYFSDMRGVMSTQVLQEFYVNVTRKEIGLHPVQARQILTKYLGLRVITVQPAHILNAIEIQLRLGTSFWDALIVAAAKEAGAAILLSEDFVHGRLYDGIRVVNPFRARAV